MHYTALLHCCCLASHPALGRRDRTYGLCERLFFRQDGINKQAFSQLGVTTAVMNGRIRLPTNTTRATTIALWRAADTIAQTPRLPAVRGIYLPTAAVYLSGAFFPPAR